MDPPSLIQAILEKGVTNLNLIGNDTGFPDVGIGRLVTNERVKSIITSHIGSNPNAGRQLNEEGYKLSFLRRNISRAYSRWWRWSWWCFS